MNEKESSLESRRQDTHHPRVGGFYGQTLTDICLEVDLKSYNKYLPAGHRHRAPKFSLNVNRCIFVCFPMFGPSSVAGAPSNMQKAIENMCFDNFGVWTKELQGFLRVVQLLGIVGEPTGDAHEEVLRLGAMQTPQALRTDPKRWTGLKEFATAAAKTDFVQPSSVAGVAAPGVPLCRCGRFLSQPACCSLCPRHHTRTCRERQKQLAEPSAPTVTGDCPVCLEPVSLMPLSCGHGVCHGCAVVMGLASHQHCPLCRAPIEGRLPSKGAGKRARTPTTPLGATGAASSSEAGYVLLKTPDYMAHLLGYHPVSWPSLEGRLGHAPGTLAGRLADLHLCLRGVKTRYEATLLWLSHQCTGEMPVHSKS